MVEGNNGSCNSLKLLDVLLNKFKNQKKILTLLKGKK